MSSAFIWGAYLALIVRAGTNKAGGTHLTSRKK